MSITTPIVNSYNIVRNQPKVVVPYLLFAILFAIIGVVVFVLLILSYLGTAGPSSVPLGTIIAFVVVAGILGIVGGAIMDGTYISMAAQGLKGKITIRTAFDNAMNKLLSLLGVTLLIAVVSVAAIGGISVIFGIGTLIATFSNISSMSHAALIAAFLSLIPFFIVVIIVGGVLTIFFYLATVLVILENKGAVDALITSINLGAKNFVTILIFLVVVFVISILASLIFAVINLIPIIGQIITFILGLFLYSWNFMLPTMFYFEYIKKPAAKTSASRGSS